MIKIDRGECPGCLTDEPSSETAYRRAEVVRALWTMQHGKCCYSEMCIPSEGHGKAVEHFRPQALFAWRRNQWTNLLLVCPQCNGRKRELFPVFLADGDEGVAKVAYLETPTGEKPAIIDPSDPTDDPERHLTYVIDDKDALFAQVVPRNSPQGRETIVVTGIDGQIFLKERQLYFIDVLLGCYRNILRAEASNNIAARDVELQTFRQYMDSSSAFAGLAREFARQKELDSRFGLQIPGPVLP